MVRLFKHYVPISLMLLGIVEFGILLASVYLGSMLRFGPGKLEPGIVTDQALLFTGVMLVVLTAVGLYQRFHVEELADMTLRLALAFIGGFAAMALLYYLLPNLYLGRGAFGLSFLCAFLGLMAARLVFHHAADHRFLKRRVLVLGTGERAAQLLELQAKRHSPFKILGFVATGDHRAVPANQVLDAPDGLVELADRLAADEVVVAVQDRRRGLPVEELLEAKMQGRSVSDLFDFMERETGKISLENLRPSSFIYCDGFRNLAVRTHWKRIFDVVASLLILVPGLPVMAITALAIRLESGPGCTILYRQTRVGRDGAVFQVLKFRSMREDAEKEGTPVWATEEDPRITRVGRFIRKVRIDELPQLINVLRGQMSFVGPRPERPEFVRELEKAIPYYGVRHRVNPGITGWAQICHPYTSSVEDAAQKLQYDLYYIKNYSLFLDFMVLLQTAHVILWSKGAR